MTNEDIVRNACQIIWSEGDVLRAGEFYADDFQADYPMTNWGIRLAGVRNLASEVRVGFPDYRERIYELFDRITNIGYGIVWYCEEPKQCLKQKPIEVCR